MALGTPQALIGLWALLAPRGFYDDSARAGRVSALGAYDEHSCATSGHRSSASACLMIVAAVRGRRSLTLTAVAVWLIFAVTAHHFHALNLGPYTTADAIANVVSLGLDRARPGHRAGAPAPAGARASGRADRGGVAHRRGDDGDAATEPPRRNRPARH